MLAAVYNPANRNLILASLQLAIIECEPKLNEMHTDGFTHAKPVSVVLYNALFKTVVTCGADSIIICWDITTGKIFTYARVLWENRRVTKQNR